MSCPQLGPTEYLPLHANTFPLLTLAGRHLIVGDTEMRFTGYQPLIRLITHHKPLKPNQWSMTRSSIRFSYTSPHVSMPSPSKHRSVTRPKPGIFLTGRSRMNLMIADRSNSISYCPLGLFLSEQIYITMVQILNPPLRASD